MGILTTTGLAKLAEAQQTGKPFVIDQIIFAYYPGLNAGSTPPVSTQKPTVDKIVHTASVVSGFTSSDTVVYKATLLPDIGNFQFNWAGLYSSATNTLVAVNYQETQTKNKTEGFDAGNIIVKAFSIQYTQAKELTGVTISADLDSWDVVELIASKADKNHAHAEYAPTLHTHAGYANATHAHNYEDLPGVSSDLASKATLEHSHAEYAPTTHSHFIGETSGLYSALAKKSDITHTHAGLLPTGFIMYWDGSTPPAGFLELNGAELSKTAYAALYAVCGNRHGQSTDGTKFKLRDARGEFIRCWDNGRGIDAGRDLNAPQSDEFRAHTHGWKIVEDDRDGYDYVGAGFTGVSPTYASLLQFSVQCNNWTNAKGDPTSRRQREITGYRASHMSGFDIYDNGGNETRPRNIALMLVIKY